MCKESDEHTTTNGSSPRTSGSSGGSGSATVPPTVPKPSAAYIGRGRNGSSPSIKDPAVQNDVKASGTTGMDGQTPMTDDMLSGGPQQTCRSVRYFFATKVPWRARVLTLALIVGLLCGVVASLYELVMDYVIEKVWTEGGPAVMEAVAPDAPKWLFILCTCTLLGGVVGALIHLLGEPLANLPGVVMAAHRDGLLGHQEAPAMAAISIASITGAGSLGPEAPLVSIGGGLASFISLYVDLSEAETLFVTMCGMGAGLAAFFGEPIGGALFACEVIHRHGLEYYEAVVPTVVAGLACNWSFRVLSNLPQEPIWTFAPEPPLLPWTSVLGVVYGVLGGLLGWAWMRGTNLIRAHVLVPYKLGPRHVVKGLLGGLLIGAIGVLHPETLFWAEHESQVCAPRACVCGGPHTRHRPTSIPHVASRRHARRRSSRAATSRCHTRGPASASSAPTRSRTRWC